MSPKYNFTPPKIVVPSFNPDDYVKIPKVNLWGAPKSERGKISPALRREVWEKRFKNKKKGKCVCCNQYMIYFDAFICGHRRAHIKEGGTTRKNLEPICLRCNSQMGTKFFDSWQRKTFPEAAKRLARLNKELEIKSKKAPIKKKVTKKGTRMKK